MSLPWSCDTGLSIHLYVAIFRESNANVICFPVNISVSGCGEWQIWLDVYFQGENAFHENT